MAKEKKYISTTEAAEIMGISRVAVFKQIHAGKIKARKVGRNYIIDRNDIGGIYKEITPQEVRLVENGLQKAIREYRETLERLGGE